MSPSEKLPWELVGEILCRMPMKSLARNRAVCKSWNGFWEDKSFLKNYLSRARPQFILRTNSKACSVDIINLDDDPIIEVHDLNLDTPCISLVHCDGFLLSNMRKKGLTVWNPWLRQKRLIENHQGFRFCGVGYDNKRPQTGYKIFGFDLYFAGNNGKLFYPKVAIYECKSDEWKFVNATWDDWLMSKLDTIVSLSGNLYWISYHYPSSRYVIRSFDLSNEIFKTYCHLPSNGEGDDISCYSQALGVYKGDRLSLLRQSSRTRKIEILVTAQEGIGGEGEVVVWINLMTFSIPNFPRLQQHKSFESQPSYFVDDDKRLFVCACDENGHACIYIVKGDVFKKIPLDFVVDLWPSHLTSPMSLVWSPLLSFKEKITSLY